MCQDKAEEEWSPSTPYIHRRKQPALSCFHKFSQLLTQELICVWNHYQLKKSLLPWRWEHFSHSELFFLDQGASGQAQQQSGPALPDKQLACAGSWWLQETTFAFLLLLKDWPKLIATHPDRATQNDKLGMFLKHFSKYWIKCGISSNVNRTDNLSTSS